MKKIIKYRIIETDCFPNSWKIETIGYKPDNGFSNFFKSEEAATISIKNNNGVVVEIIRKNNGEINEK